ncbi:MAG: hypothetical protein QOE92_1563 [Chloroflexota bacterium]|nr:hypothetical protein [Chloroflexota bacterium]
MASVENSIEIERPVEQVFAFVDDYRNATKFIVGMTEYKPLGKQVSGKGSRFRLVKKTTGLPDIKSEIEVIDWAQDRKLVFQSYKGFENGGSYTFTAKGDHTVLKAHNSYDLVSLLGGGGGLFGGLKRAAGGAMGKVAEGTVKKDLTKSLETLRDLIEKTPAAKKPVAKKPATKKAAPRKAGARR